MKDFLDVQAPPAYLFSSFRRFEPGEKHSTRICGEDVLLLVFQGTLCFAEEGEEVRVSAGEYYIQRRGLFQQGTVPSLSPYYYYIHFLGSWGDNEGIPVRGKLPHGIEGAVDRLEACRHNRSPLLEQTAAFYDILCRLIPQDSTQNREDAARVMRTYLQNNFSSEISLEELAKTFHFSPNYVIRLFKEAFGQTPYRVLTDIRLAEAETLLKYADLNLEQIAQACGFGNYVNFYRTYRRKYGKGPGRQ